MRLPWSAAWALNVHTYIYTSNYVLYPNYKQLTKEELCSRSSFKKIFVTVVQPMEVNHSYTLCIHTYAYRDVMSCQPFWFLCIIFSCDFRLQLRYPYVERHSEISAEVGPPATLS